MMRGIHHHHHEEDDDDAFSEEGVIASSTDPSMGGSTRKRRRGVIEKRRRDRINQSLNELKRLVPTALEKSGSAKLEKAEILQMTVDHLKLLQARGLNDYSSVSDPHRLAADYHGAGFRECAAEVARYLVAVEGMDLQHPMRVRIASHLQMFASSRAAQAAAYQQQQQQQQHSWSSYAPPPQSCAYTTDLKSGLEHSVDPLTGYFINNVPPPPPPPPSNSSNNNPTTPPPQQPPHSPDLQQQQQQQQHLDVPTSSTAATYPPPPPATHPYYSSMNFGLPPTPSSATSTISHNLYNAGNAASNAAGANNNKQPYRPWGAEMAC